MAGSNWDPSFLIYFLVAMALSIFFLLYLNRAFASLVSFGIRAYSWHKFRVYIDIQALQISLLGGRIFFTGLRYHGNNETFIIHQGHITWRYWLRRVREVGLLREAQRGSDKGEGGSVRVDKSDKLPCRINVSLRGVEWFVYNRTPAYDSIIAGLQEDDLPIHPEGTTSQAEIKEEGQNLRNRGSRATRDVDSEGLGGMRTSGSMQEKESTATMRPSAHRNQSDERIGILEQEGDLPLLLQLLPVEIECRKAAIVMGNENTPGILVVHSEVITTEVDAVVSSGPDQYRQTFRITCANPVVEFKNNEDFREDQASRASKGKAPPSTIGIKYRKSYIHRQRNRFLGGLRNLVPFWRNSAEAFPMDVNRPATPGTSNVPGHNQWQGLSRYLAESEEDDRTRWAAVEYAAVSTILDSPELMVTMYWDVVGKVRNVESRDVVSGSLDINGEEPPAWGIDVAIKGGSVNYGPWADRHRAELQKVFFPSLCKDAVPAIRLTPGEDRVPTKMKIYIELDEEVTIRLPTREESKNWRFRDKAPVVKAQQQQPESKLRLRGQKKKASTGDATQMRPAGWLDLKVAANSTVSYTMDMYAGTGGFNNLLSVDFASTEMSSSVNHDSMWRSGAFTVACDLSAPLKWNGARTWKFGIKATDMELFLLRDHVFLLTDLIDDWGTGPPADYLVFTPFRYLIDLELRNLKLMLNVNDANIIDNATSFEDNTYLIFSSPLLGASVTLPLDKYRPPRSSIPFEVRADQLGLSLNASQWNTQASFLASRELGQIESLTVEGQYHYHAVTGPGKTDTLVMDIVAQSPVVSLYGFLVRYVIQLKDNYFGDSVHFTTLEEYQAMLQLKERDSAAELAARPPVKKSNDFDVMLNVRVDDPRVLIPANLYSSQKHVQLEVPTLSVDLRLTNYYMDVAVSVSPVSLSYGSADAGLDTPGHTVSGTQLFIDGIELYGNRLFGSPGEVTYLCNWDVDVGAVTGECTADFVSALIGGGSAFGLMFDDEENALIPYSSLVFYDVTFLRLWVQPVKVWLHVDELAVLLSTGAIDVEFNDWARSHYSRRADINIPDLHISCVNVETAARHKMRPHMAVDSDATLKTSIRLAMVGRKFSFSAERQLQQDLLRRQDQRTMRTPFLLDPRLLLDDFMPETFNPPAQSVPPIPDPELSDDVVGVRRGVSKASSRSHPLQHKSSFMSASSGGSEASSILGGRSPVHNTNNANNSRNRHSQPPFLRANSGMSNRHSMHKRDHSASTGRHSAFYSAVGDYRDAMHHTSIAFSSQFVAPHFPLENFFPEAPLGTNFDEALDSNNSGDNDVAHNQHRRRKKNHHSEQVEFDLNDVDPKTLSEEHASTSLIVEFVGGITAVCNPAALKHFASLAAALQPVEAEDILDRLQTGAMTEIIDLKKMITVKGKMKEVLVRLPHAHVRFLNPVAGYADSSKGQQDQYDVNISRLAFLTRTTTSWEDAFIADTYREKTSLHVRVGSVEASAAKRTSGTDEPRAAVVATVESVMASVGAKDVQHFDVDVGSVRVSTASTQVEYLAGLVDRTSGLATELGEVFSALGRHDDRVRYLIYRLLQDGQEVVDAPFVVRPSAVLRSAKQQVRTFDSWKLIMRLRQIWATANSQYRERLGFDCWAEDLTVPADVAREVIVAFEGWRSWDLDNVAESNLIKHAFGGDKKEGLRGDDLPLQVACRIDEVEFLIDPGAKQNKVGFGDINVQLGQKKGVEDEADSPLMTVNVYCGQAGALVNWEMLDLAQDVLRLVGRLQDQKPAPSPVVATPELPPLSSPKTMAIHAVLVVAQGDIVLETVNLSSRTHSKGLKASFLSQPSRRGTASNFIIGFDSVTARLFNHAQVLGSLQLCEAHVFVSHALELTEAMSYHTVKATAMSESLSCVVRQDPLVLLEVVDSLVKDEAAQLYRLKELVPRTPPSTAVSTPKQNKKIAERLSTIRVNVATFLNKYDISIPLLRTLTYNISGVVARAAVAANFGRELIFDFDIKENWHEMQVLVNGTSTSKKEARSISLLRIPPTNGRVTSIIGPEEHLVTAFASVELIELDASAVYSLLRALNRPEISNTLTEIKEQVGIIQGHTTEIPLLVSASTPEARELGGAHSARSAHKAMARTEGVEVSGPVLVYDVHVTMEGLKVFGNAPLKSREDPVAHLTFWLDKVYVQACNRHEAHGAVLAQPDVHVNLSQVSVDVQRGRRNAMGSCGSIGFGATISATSRDDGDNGTDEQRAFRFSSDEFVVRLSPETISTLMEVLGYLGAKIKDIDTSRELDYLRKLRHSRPALTAPAVTVTDADAESSTISGGLEAEQPSQAEADESTGLDILDSFLTSVVYHFEVRNINFAWLVVDPDDGPCDGKEDLMLSIQLVEFGTRTKKSARLTIQGFQLQMVPVGQDPDARSHHSAVLPEVIFNVAHVSNSAARRFAFQAVGKSLNLRLTSGFIVPAAHLQESITLSINNVRQASQEWGASITGSSPSSSLSSSKPQPNEPGTTPSRSASNFFRKRRLESLLVDADFAGAEVFVSSKRVDETSRVSKSFGGVRPALAGKYGQFNADDSGSAAVLTTPGLACKVEYRDDGHDDPLLYGEIKVDASTNALYPSVVPLVMEMLAGVKEVVSDDDKDKKTIGPKTTSQGSSLTAPPSLPDEDSLLTADPSAVLGRLKVNLGLRICRQEFSLSCQPIARVEAKARFEDIYFTFNTVRSQEQGNFFAISGAFRSLEASLQHVYSRDPTGRFGVDSITLSLMNSKHVSGTSGVSAILKVSPMRVSINAKQLQDFLLFREIWYPAELRGQQSPPQNQNQPQTPSRSRSQSQGQSQQRQPSQKRPRQGSVSKTPILAKLTPETSTTSQAHLVQRYQQVAATAAFPWTATVAISSLDVSVDLGQALGKSDFAIKQFWMSSKKTSDWEQNLCIGFSEIAIGCTGRLSGYITLQDFRLRSSIQWPAREQALNTTPLVQASMCFGQFRAKASFDYQAFLAADVTSFEFLMYNVRSREAGRRDRLVAIFDGDAVQVFGTTTSAAQAVALYQAVQKLVLERKGNFETSLREAEKFMRRRSTTYSQPPQAVSSQPLEESEEDENKAAKAPISLDTDVVVTLKAVNLGVFPGTFADQQVFKIEALDAQARFAASVEGAEPNHVVHSILGLTLGQLRIGLAGVRTSVSSIGSAGQNAAAAAVASGGVVGGVGASNTTAKTTSNPATGLGINTTTTTALTGASRILTGDLSVEDVVARATGSRGGTILRVPKVEAVMQTWQEPDSRRVDYVFRSAFEGKVEVGWNYSRISYIRGMFATHERTLEQTWGRVLSPMGSIKVRGVPEGDASEASQDTADTTQQDTKITAEVVVPQSKYTYTPLEPPVIETPQLRDMGEATPPLEWIGLHRDRLPNLTHQIVIVTLLELAGEVEDAYERILGAS